MLYTGRRQLRCSPHGASRSIAGNRTWLWRNQSDVWRTLACSVNLAKTRRWRLARVDRGASRSGHPASGRTRRAARDQLGAGGMANLLKRNGLPDKVESLTVRTLASVLPIGSTHDKRSGTLPGAGSHSVMSTHSGLLID